MRSTVVAVAAVLALATDCAPRFASPEAAPEEVLAASRSIEAAPPLASHGRSKEANTAMLDGVARRMTAAAQPLCAAERREICEFHVSADPSRNLGAEAFGQGQVTVTIAMVDVLDSDDEIAAVVGHELGHHLAGHVGRQLARGMAAGTAASAVLGAVIPFGGVAAWLVGQGAAELGAGAAQLAFSKQDEREADYLAAHLVARAGYDLDRAGQVWVKISPHGAPDAAGPLDSHPAGAERLAAWRRATTEIRASPDPLPRRGDG